MKGLTMSMRRGIALFMLMTLIGLSPALVGAQEPEAAATPVQSVAPSPSAIVAVSCAFDSNLNQSSCTFTAVSETGVVDALVVPTDTFCAPVVSTTGAAVDGGVRAEAAGGSPSVTVVFGGSVQAGGGASYVVETGDSAQTVGGDGVVCGGPVGEQAPAENVEAPPPSSSEDGGVGDASPEADPEEAEAQTDESEAPAGEGDGTGIDDGFIAAATPEPAPPTVGDGTGETAAEPELAETEQIDAAAIVPVPITAYLCDIDPNGSDPAVVCDPAQGVTFNISVNGQPQPQVLTDPTGRATVNVEEGSTVVIEEVLSSVQDGYAPLGGHQTIESVTADASAVFVHVLVNGDGNLQIVNGSCPTSDDEPRTEFNVIGPRTLGAAEASSCIPTSGALFRLLSNALPDGKLVVQTGSDGAWRGPVPSGVYTVVDDSEASVELTVEPDSITVVVVVDYVPQPEGTLTVTKYLCTEGEEEGTTITVAAAPGAGGPGCGLSDGNFQLAEGGDGTGGAAEEFTLGADGGAELSLRSGDYLLTDLDAGVSATVTVAENTTSAATVNTIVLTGRVLVQNVYCDDPAYGAVDPADYAAFADGCNRPYAGMALTLLDGGGSAVSTDTGSGGGIIVWSQLLPGAYSIAGGGELCAVFAEGADARGGFAVTVGNTTEVEVYSCAPPDTNDPGDGTGGTSDGTGQLGDGGDGTGGTGGTDDLYVTALPNTGVADQGGLNRTLALLAGVMVVAAVTGGFAIRRRRAI